MKTLGIATKHGKKRDTNRVHIKFERCTAKRNHHGELLLVKARREHHRVTKLGPHLHLKLLPTVEVERKGHHLERRVATRAGVATGRS